MKKLLLGAMLAAACITTDVDARRAKHKNEVHEVLINYAGGKYEQRSTNIVNKIGELAEKSGMFKTKKGKIYDFKKSKDKTTKKILDGIAKKLREISKFFESMQKKDSKSNIVDKGEKATHAAGDLKDSLEAWRNLNSPAWQSFKKEFEREIREIANEVLDLAKETKPGKIPTRSKKELDVQTLLASLSTSFESIRGLFADEPSSVGTDQNQPNNENLLNNNAGNGENTPILIENNNQSQSSNEAPSDNNGGNANTASQNQPNKNNSLKQRRL